MALWVKNVPDSWARMFSLVSVAVVGFLLLVCDFYTWPRPLCVTHNGHGGSCFSREKTVWLLLFIQVIQSSLFSGFSDNKASRLTPCVFDTIHNCVQNWDKRIPSASVALTFDAVAAHILSSFSVRQQFSMTGAVNVGLSSGKKTRCKQTTKKKFCSGTCGLLKKNCSGLHMTPQTYFSYQNISIWGGYAQV